MHSLLRCLAVIALLTASLARAEVRLDLSILPGATRGGSASSAVGGGAPTREHSIQIGDIGAFRVELVNDNDEPSRPMRAVLSTRGGPFWLVIRRPDGSETTSAEWTPLFCGRVRGERRMPPHERLSVDVVVMLASGREAWEYAFPEPGEYVVHAAYDPRTWEQVGSDNAANRIAPIMRSNEVRLHVGPPYAAWERLKAQHSIVSSIQHGWLRAVDMTPELEAIVAEADRPWLTAWFGAERERVLREIGGRPEETTHYRAELRPRPGAAHRGSAVFQLSVRGASPASEPDPSTFIWSGGDRIEPIETWSGPRLTLEFPLYDAKIDAIKTESGSLEGTWQGWDAKGPLQMEFLAWPLEEGRDYRAMSFQGAWALYEGPPIELEIDGVDAAGRRIKGRFTSQNQCNESLELGVGSFALGGMDAGALAGTAPLRGDWGRGAVVLSGFDGGRFAYLHAMYDANRNALRVNGSVWTDSFDFIAPLWDRPAPERRPLNPGETRLGLPMLNDPPYKGAPTIIQVFGSWCPNCHDEAPVLKELHDRYAKEGLQILGLAYEHMGKDADPATDERAKRQVERFTQKYGIPWWIEVAGSSDKQQAAATLPALSAIKAFPTTIFLNRDGTVRAIHTGFAGPATGEEHAKLKAHFDELARAILAGGAKQ